jgi:Zn-dependent M28 family amino/carboxypeptidase
MAAKFISAAGSGRSVIFLACTGEEAGMLGSAWYASHPLVPLDKTVFNLNTDGAGYNDTTRVTLIDLNRTGADSLIRAAADYFGLETGGDPAPQEMFYDRSDNVSFAKEGIPALNISPGVKTFDQEIMRYYHRPADEAPSLHYHYLTRYIRSFSLAVKFLADEKKAPFWLEGDKYEKAGLRLYGGRP